MGPHVAAPPRRRSRLAFVVVLGAVLFLIVRGLIAWSDTSSSKSHSAKPTSSLAPRKVTAGAVTVTVSPESLDSSGASFKVAFDTHSVELDQDLTREARLVVGGTAWPVAGWSGPGPGGHHREGSLRFKPAGPAVGTATLTIDGLPGPVAATWRLGP